MHVSRRTGGGPNPSTRTGHGRQDHRRRLYAHRVAHTRKSSHPLSSARVGQMRTFAALYLLAHSALAPCRLARAPVESAVERSTAPVYLSVVRARVPVESPAERVRVRLLRCSPMVHLKAPPVLVSPWNWVACRRWGMQAPHRDDGASGHATSRGAQAAVQHGRSRRVPTLGREATARPHMQRVHAGVTRKGQQTTDEWYKSSRTKKGYANYVKSGKKWLVDWTAEGRLDDEISADAFDSITDQTPLALRALTAYKCEHLERGFASAEGLRSAFKDYFERVCGCQGEFWKYNAHAEDETVNSRHTAFVVGVRNIVFLWADRKWSLKAVKWWGDWSSNENVGTLMRYLLDELMAYEEGFSDIMMDDRTIDRHETFMGEDETAPVSKADLVKFEDHLLAKIQTMIASASSSVTSVNMQASVTPSHGSVTTQLSVNESTSPPLTQPPPPPPQSPITPLPYTPRPSRIPD
ncbi:hypothetical protein B0H19DRAFT_1383964 [Mycena capillaripes]|nr:hypothetical protein B0H19DRAFT_1383964 [Mycena capillaripes]